MAATKDTTIIILDVGANTNDFDKFKAKTFFEEAKSCVELVITRKIFTRPKDDISLILLGTKTTDNKLNEQYASGYENINHAVPLCQMGWDILKYVQKSIDPPGDDGITGDWLDALVVAMDYFKDLDLKKTTKKILLFTTFTTDVNDAENIDKVIAGLKHLEIELIVITKNVIYEVDQDSEDQYANFSQAIDKNSTQERSERLIKQIVMDTDGALCSIDDAFSKLIYVDKRQRRRVPWKADLTIGSVFSIKISAFIYVRDEKELAGWKTRFVNNIPQTASDGNPSTSSSNVEISQVTTKTEHFHNDESIDRDTAAENLIKGYMYGGTAVSFEDTKYDNGGKGLKFIGFTAINTIRDSHLVGDSIWAVVPQDGMITSAKRFGALLQAMHNQNLAIIARYTYRNDTAPKMMALFPSENAMLMHELFFKDNYVDIRFPPLSSKTNKPSDDQLKSIDRFIDSMDLTNDNKNMNVDHPEPFKKLLDPGLQMAYRAIAHRAINPGEPVLKVDDEILALVQPPKHASNLDELKSLFPLEAAKLSGKEAFLQNMLKVEKQEANSADQMQSPDKPKYHDVHEVGTVKPAEDFQKLLEMGEAFNLLASQIQTVIINLVVKSIVSMDEKVLQALLIYRETAKQKAPFKYNEWITNFKDVLKEREKIQLWQSIVDENLGLITDKESEMSTISAEEAQQFYKFDDFNTQHVQANNNDIEDLNMDMFDDM